MNDPITPNSETDAIPGSAEELARLSRWVEGLLDADRVLVEDGRELQEAIEEARQCYRLGDREAARRHTTRLGLAIQALVRSGWIEPAHARAALEGVDRLLHDPAGHPVQEDG
jgi:hypothetical protein